MKVDPSAYLGAVVREVASRAMGGGWRGGDLDAQLRHDHCESSGIADRAERIPRFGFCRFPGDAARRPLSNSQAMQAANHAVRTTASACRDRGNMAAG